MTIGTESIGVQSIGGDGVFISVPVVAVSITVNTPSITIRIEPPAIDISVAIYSPKVSVFLDTPYGQAIGEETIAVEAIAGGGVTGAATIALLGTIDVDVAINTPAIYAGKSVFAPSANIDITVNAPQISISATVTVPNTLDITLDTYAPHLEHIINVGGIDIAVSINVPLVATGKQVQIPEVAILGEVWTPNVYAGKSVFPSEIDIVVETFEPSIETGLIIRAWNVDPLPVDSGSIGSTTIGDDHAIAETNEDFLNRTYSIEIQQTLMAPFITAGKSVYPPPANVDISLNHVEISARTRRVRVQTISY